MDYLKDFITKEEGVETIEFIGLVAVAAVLIGVVISVGKSMVDKSEGATANFNSSIDDLIAWSAKK